ncbi:MAG: glycosyltransferase [Candidatus Omnitrophica bacterium]|nr:glycosyltransferase [Candidatus Omnitrophota bacterium]
MKILHLISSNGVFGAERVLINIAKNSSTDFQYTVCAIKNTHNPHLEILDVARSMNIPVLEIESKGKFDFGAVMRLRGIIKEGGFSIIHSHNYKSDVLAFAATRMMPCKWLSTNHTWAFNDKKIKRFEDISAWAMRFADGLIAVGEGTKAQMVQRGLLSEKISIIDNGIDIAQFNVPRPKDLKKSLGIPENNFVVTVVGRLCAEKAQSVFLDAGHTILEQRKDVTFLIVGDGELRNTLENIMREYHIEANVCFAGVRKDIPDIYAISDVFVLCSLLEGLPLCLLEAMAAKCPVVVTPVGAIPNLIKDRISGRIVPVGDTNTLAKTIMEMLSDEKSRERLTVEAYKIVTEGYSDKKMSQQYEIFYRKVMG